MIAFPYGEVVESLESPVIHDLVAGECFIWRENERNVSTLLLAENTSFPTSWKESLLPWKIIGTEPAIKSLLKKTKIPLGTKIVLCDGIATIKIDIKKRNLGFSGKRRKRVVIVDDSATMRKILKHIITSYEGWEVVAEVEKGEDLPKVLADYFPDLVTLDLHLGETNGLEAMKRYLAPLKMPTIVITSQSKADGTLVMDTLSAGALDYMKKPESGNWKQHSEELLTKMEGALISKMQGNATISQTWKAPKTNFKSINDHLVVIGSSTGGTLALQEVFLNLPKEIPPTLVVQHIPEGFSKALADRLNKLCPFEIKEAEQNDEIAPNRILIAPGGFHMELHPNGKNVVITEKEPRNRFRPSVDNLFESAPHWKKKIVSVILTGMGKDGAQMMKMLHDKGIRTIAQNEESSVVFGMPKEAIRLGAVDRIESLRNIARAIVEEVNAE